MVEYSLLNILMVLFSTQVVSTYLGAFGNHKKNHSIAGVLVWGAYILYECWVMESNANKPLFILIINIFLIFIIYKSLYQANNKEALFRAGILDTLWMLVEVATNYVLAKTGVAAMSYGFIVGNVISKLIMYISVHILKRCRKSDSLTYISYKYWVRLFFIPLVTIYVIHNTFYLTCQNQRNVFFLITTILMILINYVTFDVYDKLGSQQETEKRKKKPCL